MTAATFAIIDLNSFHHRFIKILVQKFLLDCKVPALGILHIDFPIVPDNNPLVAVGVFLVLQFPVFFQQPP